MSDATFKARQRIEDLLESNAFAIDRNTRQTAVSLEEHVRLLTEREALRKLLRMAGGDPSKWMRADEEAVV